MICPNCSNETPVENSCCIFCNYNIGPPDPSEMFVKRTVTIMVKDLPNETVEVKTIVSPEPGKDEQISPAMMMAKVGYEAIKEAMAIAEGLHDETP